MEMLKETITPERIEELIAGYRKVTDLYTRRLPDSLGMRSTEEQREEIYAAMPYDVEQAYRNFVESMEKPMPFFMADAGSDGEKLLLSWDPSYDFEGEFLRYHVQLSEDWSFENILWETDDLLETSAETELPPPGEYYWRVTVKNENGKEQIAFDQVETSGGMHAGMRRFTILEDGTVVNPE